MAGNRGSYDSSPPDLADGDFREPLLDIKGRTVVNVGADATAGVQEAAAATKDPTAANFLKTLAAIYAFNGTDLARLVMAAAAATQDETAVNYLKTLSAMYGWDGTDLRRIALAAAAGTLDETAVQYLLTAAGMYAYNGTDLARVVMAAAAATLDETTVDYLKVASAIYGFDGTDLRRLVSDTNGYLKTLPQAGELHLGEFGERLVAGTATLSIVGGTYVQYDRWGVSGVTDAALLLTLRKNGNTGYLRFLRVHVNKTGLTGTLRLHFYNVATPTTTLPADNAAFPILYANFADRLGHHDVTLGAPGGAGSDVSHAIDKDLSMAIAAAAGATGIYVAIEDRSGMTLDTPTGVKIYAAGSEN